MNTMLQSVDLSNINTNLGNNLIDLNKEQPVLLVFLRQLGCMFCKEGMTRLGNSRAYIEATGVKIVLVHMADTPEKAEKILKKYNLAGLDTIADPQCIYYARFGLVKSTVSQLFGFTAWARTIEYAYVKATHGIQFPPIGDGFQMAGMFVLQNGIIINKQQQQEIYDIPDDFENFVSCCAI